MAEILHQLVIDQPDARVYSALTEQSGIRGWLTRFAEARPEVGHVNRLTFAGAVTFEMRVDALEPNERVAWICVGGHPEWEGTTVEFTLGEVSGKRSATQRWSSSRTAAGRVPAASSRSVTTTGRSICAR